MRRGKRALGNRGVGCNRDGGSTGGSRAGDRVLVYFEAALLPAQAAAKMQAVRGGSDHGDNRGVRMRCKRE